MQRTVKTNKQARHLGIFSIPYLLSGDQGPVYRKNLQTFSQKPISISSHSPIDRHQLPRAAFYRTDMRVWEAYEAQREIHAICRYETIELLNASRSNVAASMDGLGLWPADWCICMVSLRMQPTVRKLLPQNVPAARLCHWNVNPVCRCFANLNLIIFLSLFKHSKAIKELGWSSHAVWSLIAFGSLLGTFCSPIIGAAADLFKLFPLHFPSSDFNESLQSSQGCPFHTVIVHCDAEPHVHHFNCIRSVSYLSFWVSWQLSVFGNWFFMWCAIVQGTWHSLHSSACMRCSSAAWVCTILWLCTILNATPCGMPFLCLLYSTTHLVVCFSLLSHLLFAVNPLLLASVANCVRCWH
jgi:hypothetical protein